MPMVVNNGGEHAAHAVDGHVVQVVVAWCACYGGWVVVGAA